MSFMEAVKSVYANFFNFRDRAVRSEYWWYFLFSLIVSVIIMVVEVSMGLGAGSMVSGDGGFSASVSGGPISIIWSLVNLIPSLAVAVRRMHDTDRSGWWLLIALVPLVGAIVLIVWLATKGTAGANRFGEDRLA